MPRNMVHHAKVEAEEGVQSMKHRQDFGVDSLEYEHPMRCLVLPSHGCRQVVDEVQKFAVLPKSESQ
jgi:hypothetical protein